MKHVLNHVATVTAVCLSLLLASTAQARTLVVNPSLPGADDANPGSDSRPLRSISRAAELVQPGDVVRIHTGLYRERVAIEQSGTKEQPIRFEAAPEATVVVTGADALTGWTRDSDGSYSISWPHRLFQGDEHNPGGAEQVIVGGALLRKVSTREELTEGTFFVDLQSQRLHLRACRDPKKTQAELPIEGSTRSEVWIVSGCYVHTRGLRFRYAANRAQRGMAQFRGDHGVVEDCVFEWSNSTGAQFSAEDIIVRRCQFQFNGQQGFTTNRAHRLRMDGCTVQRNNIKNYPRGWEAGGNKLCLTRGAILENSRFLQNHGNGIWFDISNVDCTVRNCFIADNEDAGIFYEISYGLHAHDNVIVGNGLADTKSAWGANGGICVSSSPGCVIERNLILGNQQGFCFREQNRTTVRVDGSSGPEAPQWKEGRMIAPRVPIWNHDEVIRDNLIVYNRTAQVQGWFDIATERHWPKAMQTGVGQDRKAEGDLGTGYEARKNGVPAALALEDLNITLKRNIYAMEPGQPFFIWGANWKRRQEFKDLASLRKTLGFEDERSQMLHSFPVSMAQRDFRLPSDLLDLVKHAYPQGTVPDCLLGPRSSGGDSISRTR